MNYKLWWKYSAKVFLLKGVNMSTRGLFGFKINGENYLEFSSHDSYPSGLGLYWRDKMFSYDLNVMKEKLSKVNNIVMKEESPVKNLNNIAEKLSITKEEAKGLIDRYDDMLVNDDSGAFDSIYKEEMDLFLNDKEFANNTLFCEYVYYYDYDINKFVMIDNRNEIVLSLPIDSKDWQKYFSVV